MVVSGVIPDVTGMSRATTDRGLPTSLVYVLLFLVPGVAVALTGLVAATFGFGTPEIVAMLVVPALATGAINSLVCVKRNLDAINVGVFVVAPVLVAAVISLLLVAAASLSWGD
jgi:hypothetical protein